MNDEKQNIKYDCLVICTGADYCSPWRSQDVKTHAERSLEMNEIREDISKAKSVLIVGGGSTGLETAGYIVQKTKSTKVGICQRGNVLLPQIEGAHNTVK